MAGDGGVDMRIGSFVAAGGVWEGVANALCRPQVLLTVATVGLVGMVAGYRRWTRPGVAGVVAVLLAGWFVGSLADEDFRKIVGRPDHVPITLMVMSVGFFLWVGLRRAALHDERLEAGLPVLEEGKDEKVLVWPDLVYIELICMVIATAGLMVWGLVLKAPLEQPANPGYAPNPAKAPWYFLGLQEMLVYFDPWMAGVVYPGLIIFGLCALPFLDTNPKGNGYYTLRERRFAVGTWLFGFLILWVAMIIFGTFLRGPNWSFFGPYETWDPHKQEALNNIDVSQVWWNSILGRARPSAKDNPAPFLPYWLVREWVGLVLVGVYLVVTPAVLRWTALRRRYESMGGVRYAILMILLLMMGLMPIKMVLRWVFNLKYFVYLPEFNANL